MRLLALAFLVLVSGCFLQGIRPTERLRETVYRLNDETRWGRFDLAQGDVDHTYREAFTARRREWGHEIRIADVELVALELDSEEDNATSKVTISWIEEDTMTLHESQIAQKWERSAGGFELIAENIVDGEEALFLEEEEEEEEASDEVEATATSRPLQPARSER